MSEIICAGFGGQGVLVAGLIIANAAMEQGRHVTWYPSYGSEMRGGTANCNIKISDREIASPYAKKPDILFAMNEASVDKFEPTVRPGGVMLVNSSLTPAGRQYRQDIRVVLVPATELAVRLHNERGANIVMLGALAQATGLFEPEYLCRAMEAYFARKGKTFPLNAQCYALGVEAAGGREG